MATADVNPDAPPPKEGGKKEKKQITIADIEEPQMDWIKYFAPEDVTVIMNRKFKTFTAIVGVYYLLQFFASISAVNLYSDISRNGECSWGPEDSKTVVVGEEASAVMDTPILLLAIYHIVEWVRCTILLTVVCLGQNLMKVWYALMVNTLFGLCVFLYAHAVYFGEAATGCAPTQPTRYTWLMVEIILFWVTFFALSLPMMYLRFWKKESIHITRYRPDEESDDDEEEEE